MNSLINQYYEYKINSQIKDDRRDLVEGYKCSYKIVLMIRN